MVKFYNEIRQGACSHVEINQRQITSIKMINNLLDLNGSIRELMLDTDFSFVGPKIGNDLLSKIFSGTVFEQLQVSPILSNIYLEFNLEL